MKKTLFAITLTAILLSCTAKENHDGFPDSSGSQTDTTAVTPEPPQKDTTTVDPPAYDPLSSVLLDVEFQLDGSAKDISGHNRYIASIGETGTCTYYSETAGINIARFFSSAGSTISDGFYKVPYNNDTALLNGLKDGHTWEVMFMMPTEKTYNGEVKPFAAMQSGGTGFLLMTGAGEIAFIPNTSETGTSTWRWARSGIVAKPGVYYHVVGVWDKENAKAHIYVDGELKGSVSAPGNLVVPSYAISQWIAIGGDATGVSAQAEAAWNGDIVIARIYDDPLDEDTVARLYEKAPKGLKASSVNISDVLMLPILTIQRGGYFRIAGKGFEEGDIITLVSYDGTTSRECSVAIGEGRIKVTPPSDLASGSYKVFVRRGNDSTLIGAMAITVSDDPVATSGKPKVVAHRGFHKTVPENSIAALKAAQDLGCYGSEMDVWITTDGKIYVNHDGVIGGKSIQNSTSEELASITLSNGEPLPTLESYLEQALKNTDTRLVIEVKQHSTSDRNRHCTEEMLRIVREMGMEPYSDYISFGWDICTRIAELRPGATIGYLTTTSDFQSLVDAGISCIDFAYGGMFSHPEYFTEAHRLGLEVNIWTVDALADMARGIALGADYITTNNSDELIALTELLFD